MSSKSKKILGLVTIVVLLLICIGGSETSAAVSNIPQITAGNTTANRINANTASGINITIGDTTSENDKKNTNNTTKNNVTNKNNVVNNPDAKNEDYYDSLVVDLETTNLGRENTLALFNSDFCSSAMYSFEFDLST